MDAADWDARYAKTELVWTATPNRWVVETLAGRPPGTAVDLACGEGRNAVWLAGQGWQVTGVDFSIAALRKAAALAWRGDVDVEWVHADATTWAAEQPVDLVVIAYLHLPEAQRRRAHRAAAAGLAPGGTLLVVGHDTANLTEGVGGPQDRTLLFTPTDVLADVAGMGLHTVRAEQVTRTVKSGDGVLRATDALAELRRLAPHSHAGDG